MTAPLFSDAALADLFSDEVCVRRMLTVEAALARAEAAVGLIPASAAAEITRAAAAIPLDLDDLARGFEREGVPVVALSGQMKRAVSSAAAAFVHHGATTQDILDTALVLQAREALALLGGRLDGVIGHLARLARTHRGTLMAGRTHAQQALPITFGLKIAGWLAPLLRHRDRLDELGPRLCCIQLGGAAGTLASMYPHGQAVAEAFARELGLGVPIMPWHTQRDALAELAGWLSLVSGSLGKMAQDIVLMAQTEVGEVQESADPSRGGSSTMPQKQNPIRSEVIIAAARANATALSAMHHALIQEHERATHGWQLEWLTLPAMFAHTAAALNQATAVLDGMAVDTEHMRRHVVASNGSMLAEAARLALVPHIGDEAASRLVREAVATARAEARHLIDVLVSRTDAPIDWPTLREEAGYLGTSDHFIEAVLARAERDT